MSAYFIFSNDMRATVMVRRADRASPTLGFALHPLGCPVCCRFGSSPRRAGSLRRARRSSPRVLGVDCGCCLGGAALGVEREGLAAGAEPGV
jgi:hypothetical protein